jgi:hypothetical protein
VLGRDALLVPLVIFQVQHRLARQEIVPLSAGSRGSSEGVSAILEAVRAASRPKAAGGRDGNPCDYAA